MRTPRASTSVANGMDIRRIARSAATGLAAAAAPALAAEEFDRARQDRHLREMAAGAADRRPDGLDDRAVEPVGDGVRRLDRDVHEADRREPGPVLRERERTGDAAAERT